MLPKNRRVSKEQIGDIWKLGRGCRSGSFALQSSLRPDRNVPSSFAVIVSSGVAKTATRRNFLKRRIRYVLSKILPKVKNGFRCAVMARKDLSQAKFAKFESELLSLLNTAGLIK